MKASLPAEEVVEQQQLLQTYRHTLAIYLRQSAQLGGVAYSPPALLNGIDEARQNIARIKGALQDAGIDVADDPDDEAVASVTPIQREAPVARRRSAAAPPQRSMRWLVVAGAAVVAAIVIALLGRWINNPRVASQAETRPTEQRFTVQGAAMEPTFHVGQQVTIEPVDVTTLRRGDVILITPYSKEPFLKRLIGLPGDTVDIREGRVYINGDVQQEPYVQGAATLCQPDDKCTSVKVLNGSVYVLGDNRGNSADSREFGPVPLSEVKGRVSK